MLCVRYPFYGKNLKKDECILDIETTGLDPKKDKLVVLGLIYFDYKKNKFYIDQYFSKNDKEEVKLLKIYKEKIQNKKLITYNGDIFDPPFLNIRLIENKEEPIWQINLDLYKIIKNKRKLIEFDSMKLTNIEKIVGIERNDPSRYKVISKLSDDIKNRNNPRPILIHNKNDLIATEAIANIEEIINDELSFEINNYKIHLDSAYIDKDIAYINFISDKILKKSYFRGENYSLNINDYSIELKIIVLYGKLSKNSSGFVTVNNFNIENKGKYKINKNLISIMEDKIFSCENILNIMKFLIEKETVTEWINNFATVSSICQSIGLILFFIKKSLVFENGFEPKNPLWAANGDGWALFKIKCLLFVISSSLDWANLPQRINTRGFSLWFNNFIILSVNIVHPMSLWEFAWWALTVNVEFNNKTPWLAHLIKFPLLGIYKPKSSCNSL